MREDTISLQLHTSHGYLLSRDIAMCVNTGQWHMVTGEAMCVNTRQWHMVT